MKLGISVCGADVQNMQAVGETKMIRITDSFGEALTLVSVRSAGPNDNEKFYVVAKLASSGEFYCDSEEIPASTLKADGEATTVMDACLAMVASGQVHQRYRVRLRGVHLQTATGAIEDKDKLRPEIEQWLDHHCKEKRWLRQSVGYERQLDSERGQLIETLSEINEIEFANANDAFEFKMRWG